MRTYLYAENGFAEQAKWRPNCWINVVFPDEEDIRFLTLDLKVPESFLTDIEDIDERPRIETEDGWRLAIVRLPMRGDEKDMPFITVPLGIISRGEIFITVCHFATEVLPDFIRYTQRKNLTITNQIELTMRLIFSSTVWFQKYLKQINNQMHLAEIELRRSIRNEELYRLMKIERSIVFFNTSIGGNNIMLAKLRAMVPATDTDAELVEDLRTEIKQAYTTAGIYSDILSGMMDAFASVISNNVNQIMKRMTSISIILMLPTLIASFYGMNLPSGLENKSYAFACMVAISAVLTAFAFYIFRKIKWF